MPRIWTAEQRAEQAARCRANRPWLESTGPKTTEGKAKSARNAYKGDPLKRAMRAVREGNFTLAKRLLRHG